MKIWQIATGETGRDYRELFFNHDIMILGPSDLGNAKENNYHDGIPNTIHSQVHNFAHSPKSGDRVVMRFGKKVIGVGQIPESDEDLYSFNETFRCVYGWHLCHCRRVIWAKNYDLRSLANVYKDVKQKPSFTAVHEKHIVDEVKQIAKKYFRRSLKEMPKVNAEKHTSEGLGVELFRAGLSNKNIEDLLRSLQQSERISSWYRTGEQCGRNPTEHEIVTHMVLPLFLGLGWSHQQIAVEWSNVDMAFFKETPTVPDNCIMILEAKGMGQPLSKVLDQPLNYIDKLNLVKVKYVLTTDGDNIFVYKRKRNSRDFDENPCGYLNIWSLQKEYILPKDTGAVDTLVMLQPSLV